MRLDTAILGLGLVLGVLAPSLAAPPGKEVLASLGPEDAYDRGVAAFKAKEFETAVVFFEHAHKLDPSETILFNIARAYQELATSSHSPAHIEQAIYHFRLYVERAPTGADRADAEARVERLLRLGQSTTEEKGPSKAEVPEKTVGDKTVGDKTVGDKTGTDKTGTDKTGTDKTGTDKTGTDKAVVERSVTEAPTPATPLVAAVNTDHDGFHIPPATAATLLAGAVCSGLGGVMGLMAESAKDDFDGARDTRGTAGANAMADAAGRVETFGTGANVAFIAGGALVATGLVLWLLEDDTWVSDVSVSPTGMAVHW